MTPLLLVSLLASYLCSVAGQSQCITPNGKSGDCVSIRSCSPLLSIASNPTPTQIIFLRSSFCGYDGSDAKVCCPKGACTTPDGALGTCIGLLSCPSLVNMLTPNPTQESIQYVQRSRCQGSDSQSVCCKSEETSKQPQPTIGSSESPRSTECQLTAFPPHPNTDCCGAHAGSGTRIIGGVATALDEYPWLALIEYVKNNRFQTLCGGVLISGRYVLTAGHCVVGPVLNIGRPVNVRLGEYNATNSGVDCVETEGGGQDCNDGAVTVGIEKVIAHPDYHPSSDLKRHDIALLRLNQIVNYTEFIRPICLPTADFTTAPSPNTMLFTAGWGAINNYMIMSDLKLKVGLPYLSIQDCQPSYQVPSRRVQLWDGQICAGGDAGKDSCKGDSGGPLMKINNKNGEDRVELVGVVSFGPVPCGMDNVPGVYSKVYQYLPWITSQIVAQ